MKNFERNCNLSELKIGQEAIVKNIKITDRSIKRHLLDMGVTKGVKVKIKKIAPMGDPICIELRGYELIIRKENLQQIEAEIIYAHKSKQ